MGAAVWISGGPTSPAGSDTQIQFNNAGTFGASANLTWNNDVLTINTIAKISTSENVDVDTGIEDVDTFATTDGNACEWLVRIDNGSSFRTSKVIAAWDGVNIDFSETSTNDVGTGTVDVTLSVDINAGNVRLRGTASTNNWDIKVHRVWNSCSKF